jgi:hypothetical protein
MTSVDKDEQRAEWQKKRREQIEALRKQKQQEMMAEKPADLQRLRLERLMEDPVCDV